MVITYPRIAMTISPTGIPLEWGRTINFDGPGSDGVRGFVVQNACNWIEEFHVDSLKIDATQSIRDASDHHILAELSTHAHRVAGPRSIVMIAEKKSQDIHAVWPLEQGGWGFDAMWSNDFPHLTRVAAVLIPHHPLDLTRY
jgi:maltooligosyltrehalose trehalohydrolase